MATIDLITYDQKMVTPKDDALIHQFGISNGILYGCDVTLADSNTLHITGGQGVIYGRQWEITEGDITVTLPASGSLKGRLYVKIDLSNTTNPIELLVQTDVTLPDLTDDDQINVNNSVSELELYTFDVSSLTISNLVKTVETVADGDHADVVQIQNDISQLNSSMTYKTGDYISPRAWKAIGRVINSGKGILVTIYLPKPIIANGATITVGDVYIYGITNYVFDGTISNVSISGNELSFVLGTTGSNPARTLALAELHDTAITLT